MYFCMIKVILLVILVIIKWDFANNFNIVIFCNLFYSYNFTAFFWLLYFHIILVQFVAITGFKYIIQNLIEAAFNDLFFFRFVFNLNYNLKLLLHLILNKNNSLYFFMMKLIMQFSCSQICLYRQNLYFYVICFSTTIYY